MAIYDLGENKVVFDISRDGKVRFNHLHSTISTSFGLKIIQEEIVPKVQKHFEDLLREKLEGR